MLVSATADGSGVLILDTGAAASFVDGNVSQQLFSTLIVAVVKH